MVRSPRYPHQGGAISVLYTPKCGADKAYQEILNGYILFLYIPLYSHCSPSSFCYSTWVDSVSALSPISNTLSWGPNMWIQWPSISVNFNQQIFLPENTVSVLSVLTSLLEDQEVSSPRRTLTLYSRTWASSVWIHSCRVELSFDKCVSGPMKINS